MVAPPILRSRHPLWIGVVVAALAMVLLVPLAFGGGLAVHSECTLAPVGTESVWTPGVTVNSPPNGTATGWANGSVLGADEESSPMHNGSAGVLEVLMNWTVDRTTMDWTTGPGLRDACTRPYWATAAGPVGATADAVWCLLQGPGNGSDIGLSTETPVTGCPFLGTPQAAEFNESFGVGCPSGSALEGGCGARTLEDGGSIRSTFHASVVGLSVEIPLPRGPAGSWIEVADPMNQAVTYTTFGPGCWVYESPAGPESGLLTWGPYAAIPPPGPNAVCTFG
ncbi:MAG: hypothetical protein L3K16_08200 [Thermoplasmata archaeon]|nr:hypothetical protein [Thermoplasmata archaeon]